MKTHQANGVAFWKSGLAALLVAVGAGLACDKVPLTAPSESTIILFANTTNVTLQGTVDITATVMESAGTPVQNGTVVTFYTTLGTIDPVEARTQGGKATVRLHAGAASGVATIRATSGGITTTDPQLTINVGGAAASRVELFATPAALPAGGGTVQMVAAVYDDGGNRLPSVQVSFVTDAGTVSPTTVTTDASGEARSVLQTPTAARVTATVASTSSKTITNTVSIAVRTAPTVSVSVGTASPTAGQPVSLTFTVTPGTSGAAVRSAVADFGDGGSQTLNTNGTTTASHTYTRAGSYTIIATATDAAGETTVSTASLTVAEAAPVGVTLNASGVMTSNSTITFSTSVTGATSIESYQWNFGDGGTRTTNGGSTTHVYGKSGHYTITVRVTTVDGRTGTAQIEIILL